ncbi:MAG TPA: hypothetical protein VHX49_13185 [Candidatus Acidoferrales bacterium]|nr:hypothetical protein [Candidatus Acidoferrales bacterium]
MIDGIGGHTGHTAKAQDRGRRSSSEAGYAYILALAIIVAVIIGSQVVLENMITQGRRQREQETIWRGKQWARAIRLYYHKTGHYPQSTDDLETGVPDVHFLRASAIKDPMEPDDGSWRFIYVNSTGQIIGSVRYATLQQMALLDLNNGQMPGTQSLLPGAVSAASLSSLNGSTGASDNDSTSTTDTNSTNNATNTNGAANGATGGSASVGGTNSQNPQGTAPPGDASSNPQGSTDNSAAPGGQQNSGFTGMPSFGQGQSASTFGSSGSNTPGQNTNPLAQLMQLQPTGPVDGPVPGAFLTGVAIPVAIDQNSIRIYHGAKKYKDWEFIWNPLEDQAQALQQGLQGAAQGVLPGQTQPGQTSGSSSPATNPFGNSFGAGSSGATGTSSPGPGSTNQQQ